MSSHASIAVVIPAFNASAFIADAIRSVLAQTLSPSEVLVVDDGSTDDTASIAESFAPLVRVVCLSNIKQAAARNFGISEAKTEWVAFLDADDLWEPHKLARQMDVLNRDSEADLCYCGHRSFSETDGEIIFHDSVRAVRTDQLGQLLHTTCAFLPSSVVIRRSVVLEAGGFATDLQVAEDWDLWLRLHRAGIQFAACSEPLFLYRRHPDSITANRKLLLTGMARFLRLQVLPYASGRARLSTAVALSNIIAETALVMWQDKDERYLYTLVSAIRISPLGLQIYKTGLKLIFLRFSFFREYLTYRRLRLVTVHQYKGQISTVSAVSKYVDAEPDE